MLNIPKARLDSLSERTGNNDKFEILPFSDLLTYGSH